MLLMAIDPGATGAIVMQRQDYPVQVVKMPDTPRDLYELLRGLHNINFEVRAVVEKISTGIAMKPDADGAMKMQRRVSSMMKLQKHVGHVEMALIACCIPFEEVSPQKWMQIIPDRPKDQAQRKRAIKDFVQRRWPDVKVTLWNADALGILYYALQQESIGT